MSKLPPKSRANKPFAVPPPPPSDQQRQRQKRKRSRSCLSIFALLVISLYFVHYYWKSSPPDDRQARAQAASLLASLESQLGSYIAWLNGTNSIDFTLPSVSDEQTKIIAAIQPPGIVLNSTEQSYFSNVTGRVRAEATVYNLSTPPTDVVWAQDAHALMAESKMNSTEVAHKLGQWNWKAVGRVALDVLKKRPDISPNDDSEAGMEEAEQMERIVEDTPDIVPIEGHVKLTDRLTEDEFKLKFSGVHFVSNGSIVAIAHPVASALDIRTLPAFVPPSVRNATAHALLPVLYAQIDALRERVSSPTLSSPSSSFLSSPTTPASTCTFTVYAQLAPSNITAEQMAEFEAETTHPTGAHVVDRPNLLADFTLVSPECGVLIVVEKAEKSRYWEMFSRKVAPYVGFSTLVHFSLLVLLLREMVRTSKAASLAGIARWTIVTQIFADELSLGSHAMFPIYFKRGPLLLVPAFLSLLLFLLEVLFAMIIMTVQGHEDAADRQAAASGRGVRAWLVRMVGTAEAQARGDSKSDAPDANAGALAEHSAYTFPPLPAAPTQRPSFLRQFWYDLCTDRDSQISLVLIFAIFILTRYINVPHVTDLAFCALYLSIWTPQIFRSISQGRRCAFSGEYMIGTTICRLVYAMYFVACPKNLLDIEPQGWIYTLALAMFAQVGFITLQKIRGPAFFLPKRYGPSSAPYNYHPLLAPGPGDIDIEAGRADSLGDCGICKDAIRYDAKVLEGKAQEKETAYGARKRRILAQFELALGPQKSYSLAPCHHIFHTDCLEKWLVTKTACPQCKRPLPPL